MADVMRVEGVQSTIRQLRKIDPSLARESIKQIKAPAVGAAADLRSTAPAQVLSGVKPGRTAAGVRYGGRGRAGQRLLVSVRLNGPRWTVVADMAEQDHTAARFSTNVRAKHGGASSRFAWPTVERHRPQINAALMQAVREVEKQLNGALRGRG